MSFFPSLHTTQYTLTASADQEWYIFEDQENRKTAMNILLSFDLIKFLSYHIIMSYESNLNMKIKLYLLCINS